MIELTRKPFSSFRDAWGRYTPAVVAGLTVPLDQLDDRIEQRLRGMLDHGLLDEVRALIDRGHREALVASQAIPYRQAVALLEETITREEFLEEAARATRRLARRQLSWFRRDPRIRWFDTDEQGAPGLVDELVEYLDE